MRETRQSGLRGGGADNRSPYLIIPAWGDSPRNRPKMDEGLKARRHFPTHTIGCSMFHGTGFQPSTFIDVKTWGSRPRLV